MGLISDFHEWPDRLISESGLPNACCTLEPAGIPIHTSRPKRRLAALSLDDILGRLGDHLF